MDACVNEIDLTLPTEAQNALVARMALSGVGVLAGLDVDMIGDLRVVVNECFDCLTHQRCCPRRLRLRAWIEDSRLYTCFEALERSDTNTAAPLDMDVTLGVLETLMPEIKLVSDEDGISAIECSMPI